jgi:hypothetical protein
MPQLIRTPEEIFREEAKDIYLIRFKGEKRKSAASKEIEAWITTNLPGTLIEPLAPSEHSGWIEGYFGDLRIDFSEDGLKQFCDRWETPDGASIDARFQCYLMPYREWLEKHGHYMPSNLQPTYIGITVWIDTPIGIIYHQLDEESIENYHPAKAPDLWMNAVRLWPELKDVNFDDLPYGNISRYSDMASWVVIYSDPIKNGNEFTKKQKAVLREWFNLPKGIKMRNEWD